MTDLKTQATGHLETAMVAAELADERVKDLQGRVAMGTAILAAMELTDARRAKTVALLALRQRELAAAQVEAERLHGAFTAEIEAGVAPVDRVRDRPPSLRCVVCGQEIHGNGLQPGFWTHLTCLD
jgi:hypothetical protein